jgi:hypothetical protein
MAGTVQVEVLEGSNTLVITWEHTVAQGDTAAAFRRVTDLLDQADSPLVIIVDLRNNPSLPINETFREALSGPFKHRMLEEWLVVGAGPAARGIGRGLSVITNRHNIRWYDSMDAALAYLYGQNG